MGFNNGIITLNSPNSAYYPGQIISGNITFTLDMPTTFAVITVTFTGKGKVEWQEADGDQCAGQEEYFNVTLPLCGGNGLFTLPAGEHQYSFQCQIPFEVPGTFEDDKGSIEYYVEAVADSPSICKESVTKPFTVVVPVDLNNIEECKQPIEMEFEKSSGACCFGGGAVAVQFRVPVSGFCPGQTIPIHVSVDNESSNVEIRRLLFELISVTAYRSQSPRSELITPPEVVERIKRGPLLCKAKGDFIVDFPVPALIAPSLDVCELFGIEYSLRVTIKMTGCSKDESDEATIYIGHVPLNGTGDFVHPLKENLPSGPIPIKPFAPPVLEQKQNVSLPQNAPFQQSYPQGPPNMAHQMPYQPVPYQPVPYPQMPAYPQNTPYPPQQQANNLPYPPMYPQQNPVQNVPYNNAPMPQVNWQWNGGSGPQVGYSNNQMSPSAPSF